MSQLHVITTHSKYVSTIPDGALTGEEDVQRLAEALGSAGDRDFTIKADGIGWVAINPAHIVAVELHEETQP